jgi:uncharacterized lipoprotein YajG
VFSTFICTFVQESNLTVMSKDQKQQQNLNKVDDLRNTKVEYEILTPEDFANQLLQEYFNID